MHAERPRMTLVLQPLDKWLETLAISGFVVLWLFFVRVYTILPDIIPIHFNLKGVTDGYGSRNTLFILPLVASCIYALITVLNRYPYLFNYMVTITAQNAETQYRLATRLLRVIKLVVIIVLGFISMMVAASVKDASITRWIGACIPVIIAIFIVPTIVYIYYAVKNNTTTTR